MWAFDLSSHNLFSKGDLVTADDMKRRLKLRILAVLPVAAHRHVSEGGYNVHHTISCIVDLRASRIS